MEPIALIALYLLFRLKHFACDFLFQTDWMALTKGKPGKEGYSALFTHTAIHAVGTVIVTVIFAPALWWLGLVDFVVHAFSCVRCALAAQAAQRDRRACPCETCPRGSGERGCRALAALSGP